MTTEPEPGSGILIVEDGLNLVPETHQAYAGFLLDALRELHAAYQIQRHVLGIPAGVTEKAFANAVRKSPLVASPYHFLTRDSRGLVPHEYYAIPEIRVRFTGIADCLEGALECAQDNNLQDKTLIEQSLRSQIRGFRRGDFRGMREQRLNLSNYPLVDGEYGFLDRYGGLSTQLALHGWVTVERRGESRRLNRLMMEALMSEDRPVNYSIRSVDVVGFGGLAVDMGGWTAQTLPSEKDLRRDRAGVEFFMNCMESRRGNYVKNLDLVPQVKDIPNWEELVLQVRVERTAAHEAGHVGILTSEETVQALGRNYQGFEEAFCEAWGVKNRLRVLTPRDLDRAMLTVANSLADGAVMRGSVLQDSSSAKEYGLASAIILNGLVSNGGITLNTDNGSIIINDLNDVEEGYRRVTGELGIVLENESPISARVNGRNFIRRHAGPINLSPFLYRAA